MEPTPQTAIVQRKDLRSLLNSDQVKAEIGRALPEHLTPDRFIRVMLTTLTRTPKLADCSRESVMRCLMDCSALGIEPDGRRAHLIPYGKECQLILDYKGLIELARRSGDIASIRAELVCEADEFAWRNGEITHEVNWRAPRGDIQAVYAIATLRSGETQSAVLTRDEVEGIRKRSKAGNSGPWVTDFGEMAKKTAVRRLCKMLPLSVELAEAMDRDDDRISERNVTPVTPVKLSLPAAAELLDVAEAKSEVEYVEGGAE